MCRSMVDIQSPTAEIRRGKKRRKKQDENIYGLPYYIGRPVCGQALKPTFDFFYPTPENLAGEKSNILPTHCESEARKFVTAQHMDKQKYIFHLR